MTDPEEPPPIVRTNTPDDEPLTPEEQAEYDEGWELGEAQDQARVLAARFATRLYVAPEGQHIRLVFGERINGETSFHTALIIPAGEALQMAQLLSQIAGQAVDIQIANNRSQLEALKKLRGMDPADG